MSSSAEVCPKCGCKAIGTEEERIIASKERWDAFQAKSLKREQERITKSRTRKAEQEEKEIAEATQKEKKALIALVFLIPLAYYVLKLTGHI